MGAEVVVTLVFQWVELYDKEDLSLKCQKLPKAKLNQLESPVANSGSTSLSERNNKSYLYDQKG